MKRTFAFAVLALASLPLLAQPAPGGGPGSGPMRGSAPQVDVAKPSTVIGDVVSYNGGPGVGMPTLTVKVGGKEQSYVLGPYRYLGAQKFAPAAGDNVRLLLYACSGCRQGVAVAEVENLTQKTTLKLRNADGTPVFSGRWRGRGPGAVPTPGTNPNTQK